MGGKARFVVSAGRARREAFLAIQSLLPIEFTLAIL